MTIQTHSGSRNWPWIVVVFTFVFVGLYWFYLELPDRFLADEIYFYGITAPSATAIDFVAPGESVRAAGDQLVGPTTSLAIVRGCDGAGFYFLLIAAIVGVGSSWKRTIAGIIGATIFVYVINQLRIITLYFTLARHREWFVPLHAFAFPALFIGLGLIYFTVWLAPHPVVSNDRVSPAAT